MTITLQNYKRFLIDERHYNEDNINLSRSDFIVKKNGKSWDFFLKTTNDPIRLTYKDDPSKFYTLAYTKLIPKIIRGYIVSSYSLSVSKSSRKAIADTAEHALLAV